MTKFPKHPIAPLCLTLALVAGAGETALCQVDAITVSSIGTTAASPADATERLQAAIDDSTGILELPAGIHVISRPLVIDLRKTKCREVRGNAATEVRMVGPGPAFRVLGSHYKSAAPAGFTEQVWTDERMPTFVGFGIRGDHKEADGIQATGTMQLTASRMHLRKLQHGVHLVENNRNVIIENCHIYECSGVGIYYDDVNLHQSNIVGCHVSYCDAGGLVSRGGNVRNIHISGSDFEGNMSAKSPATANILIDCRTSEYGTAEVAITGCTIQHTDDGPDSANIRIFGTSKRGAVSPSNNERSDSFGPNEGNITITGNVLSDVQHNIHLNGCRGVTVVANTLWMGFTHNMLVENCSYVVATGNNMDRNPRYDYGNSTTSKNLVVFENCRRCTIDALSISNITAGPAIEFRDYEDMLCSKLAVFDAPLAIRLSNVSNSIFSSCMLRTSNGRPRVEVSGGHHNELGNLEAYARDD